MKTLAFASAAHEFRNPLNGIITSLDLLKKKIDLSGGDKYFTIAYNCSKLMLFLVNDILDYA
jgi:signal transduction histidine kinase